MGGRWGKQASVQASIIELVAPAAHKIYRLDAIVYFGRREKPAPVVYVEWEDELADVRV